MLPRKSNGHQHNGHVATTQDLLDTPELNIAHIQGVVPIEYFVTQLLEKLSPRTTQRVLLYYAHKMNELI